MEKRVSGIIQREYTFNLCPICGKPASGTSIVCCQSYSVDSAGRLEISPKSKESDIELDNIC